jgi:hypothetical protein
MKMANEARRKAGFVFVATGTASTAACVSFAAETGFKPPSKARGCG